MGERCPVQTSAVYVLGRTSQFPVVPPPSPPSPANQGREQDLCAPIEELSLDAAATATSTATTTDDAGVLTSPPATAPTSAPDSPDLSPCVLSPNLSSCSLASFANAETGAGIIGKDGALGQPTITPAAAATAAAAAAFTPSSDPVSTRLAGAVHVLATEATALQSVAQLYATSPAAREGFTQAVEAIVRTQTAHPPGKLVIVGVGKSGHIGRKLVATFNSLAVPSSFLHPTEALHGDLGHIRAHDVLLFITYSGKTQELVTLLPHVDPALPLIILTSHVTAETCELVSRRNEHKGGEAAPGGATILLPAPIPVEEKVSFGVAAPTASTTTALAVGDALAIVTSKELHPSTESVFRRNHPGGAIGAAFRRPHGGDKAAPTPDTVRHLAVPWSEIPVVRATASAPASSSSPDCADVLRAGYSSSNGWVRVVVADGSAAAGKSGVVAASAESIAPPSRIRSLCSADLARPVHEVGSRLVVGRVDFVAVAADTQVRRAAEWLRAAVAENRADEKHDGDVVVAVMENGEIVGVLELQDLLKATMQ